MNTENSRAELTENELEQVSGGRVPIPIVDWQVSARFLYENNHYLFLPEFMQEPFLYYLQYGEYSMIGDMIKQNLVQYGAEYPILREAFNASVVGYR